MQIYQFTYVDYTNETEESRYKVITDALKQEAAFQNWSPGYKFKESKPPVVHSDGSTERFYVVEGSFDMVIGSHKFRIKGV